MFRKAALEKMSSPEQLDLMMRVTSPIGWLALLTLAVVLAGALVWSVVGSIPELVDGRGVLLTGERVFEVKAPMSGTIVSISATPDSTVHPGDVIAVLKNESAQIEERQASEATMSRDEMMIETKKGEIASLQQQKAVQADLVRRGLKAENVLFDYDQRVNADRAQINEIQRELDMLHAQMESTAKVTTPEGGRVVEVVKGMGDGVRQGEPILRIELSAKVEPGAPERICGGGLHVLIYVPADLAGKVRPGQPARISPLDVKKEEFGYLEGKVAWISSFAASPEDMHEKLQNDALVQAYSQQGPVFEARACLVPDPANTMNGYKWSSSTGPNRKITGGGQCTVSMVVAARRPYTYVIPAIRRAAGL